MENDSRALRFRGRNALRYITTVKRCADCGHATVAAEGAVAVRRTDEGVVGFAGLASCGRVWLCPVCNAKIMARRTLEIGLALAWAHANGFLVIWGSLTQRHSVRDGLASMLELQTAAWRQIVSSKFWRAANTTKTVPHEHVGGEHDAFGCEWDCERKRDIVDTGSDGRVGYIRAAEITTGFHGWHPHFHPMIFWRGSRESAEIFAEKVVDKWVESVIDLGGDALAEGGQLLRVLDEADYTEELGKYTTKATYVLAVEATWSQNKSGTGKGKGKSRAMGTASHWSLLAGIEQTLETGEVVRAVDLWQELEEGTHGHRMFTWSRGLRSFAGLTDVEQSDEDIAAEEVGDSDDAVCFITPNGWHEIRNEPETLASMLKLLEEHGWSMLRDFLDEQRIEYFTPDMARAGQFA